MRKISKCVAIVMMATMLLGMATTPSAAADKGRGGVMGFISGCCFGIRAGADYNDGKEIHWREWVRIVPYLGIVFAVWDGVDGASGKTRAQYAEAYGATYY